MILECIEEKHNGLPLISIIRGHATVLTICFAHDHSGRGRNWVLRGTNIACRCNSIKAAKRKACQIYGASAIASMR